MKIVFTTSGSDINAPLDSRFGRASRFLVYDLDDDTFDVFDNTKNLNAAQGVGIQAAETVAKLGAQAIVTGHCGPKAYRTLLAAGIKVYNTDTSTVKEALEQYREGQLVEASSENREGHWI